MKNLLFITIASLFFISCSPYYQLYETKTTSPMKEESSSYTFENDTVKIVYSFWENHGVLSYNIYNKLSIPIYIDLKKSSFIRNGQKYDYYIDETSTNTIGSYKNFLFSGDYLGMSYHNSTTIKQDPIIFIAPKSATTKVQFLLYPFSKTDLPKKVESTDFDYSNSILSFRNFLTISTTDKFEKESYIDNGFYVSKISNIKEQAFRGKLLGYLNGRVAYQYPYQSPTKFYVEIK